MITIEEEKITFVEKHLFEPKIETTEGILERYSEYDVEFFLHVVSDPSCRYESGVGASRVSEGISELSAKERFISLLYNRELTASPKGFYANKCEKDSEYPDEIKSVSFAHCKLNEVKRHFEARNSMYSVVFYHDYLQSLGMVPVRYINGEDPESIRRLVFNEPFSLEAYGRRYDMRWEKEWRINKDVEFETSDVAFIVVPDNEYGEFIDLTITESLDYVVLPASVFIDPFEFFLVADSLEHHFWSQMCIFGGWKVDLEMFPSFSEAEKEAFLKECGEHLECLVKVEVQELYESRYVSRFMNFASSLKKVFLAETSFNELSLVQVNANEPSETHRDLMMHCYTKRAEIQKEFLM
ncbi:hypothetical protein L4D08_00075 [Photobacterium chitinilyticum]|uniref:hypothetical protein n=1 Tax=Photobacterium chitinilyticum TaxID=2485123 RepID=UPI003D13D38E